MPDTDRELLELAARAIGLPEPDGWHHHAGAVWLKRADGVRRETRWNSLTDHGDALRLAAALYFTVAIRRHEVEVFDEDGDCLCSLPILRMSMMAPGHRPDTVEEVVCRAITTAAAAMAPKPDARDPGVQS